MIESLQSFLKNKENSVNESTTTNTWEVWFGEQAPRGGNEYIQKIRPKRPYQFLHISTSGEVISFATLDDIIGDLEEDDEFAEIIKNLQVNETYADTEIPGEVYIRVS